MKKKCGKLKPEATAWSRKSENTKFRNILHQNITSLCAFKKKQTTVADMPFVL